MRNPCNWKLISIQVRFQFFDSSLRGSFAKSRVPVFEEPLRQLRDVFGVLNQVANLNSAHTNSMFGLTRTSSATGGGSATLLTLNTYTAPPLNFRMVASSG